MEYIRQSSTLKAAANGTAGAQFAPTNATDKWRIKEYAILPNATSATNGTDYASIRAYKSAGTSTPIAAARTTASTSLTVSVPEPITLTAVGVGLEITQADPLHVEVTQAASGVAVDVTVAFMFEMVR